MGIDDYIRHIRDNDLFDLYQDVMNYLYTNGYCYSAELGIVLVYLMDKEGLNEKDFYRLCARA